MPRITRRIKRSSLFTLNGPCSGVPRRNLSLYFANTTFLLPVITAYSQFTTSTFSPSNARFAANDANLPMINFFASMIMVIIDILPHYFLLSIRALHARNAARVGHPRVLLRYRHIPTLFLLRVEKTFSLVPLKDL